MLVVSCVDGGCQAILAGSRNALEAASGSFATQKSAVDAIAAANLAAGTASPLVEGIAIVGLELQLQRVSFNRRLVSIIGVNSSDERRGRINSGFVYMVTT